MGGGRTIGCCSISAPFIINNKGYDENSWCVSGTLKLETPTIF